MSLSCGFYNSINHDRLYDARQFARIFDGIISDGIYATIGDCFVVKAQSGRTVTVGTGRAWFNGTWTLNDSLLPIELPLADTVTNRTDAVVLEVDTTDAIRNNSIQIIQGAPGNTATWPSMDSGREGVYWYPLCYIYRGANSTEVRQSDITNRVGFAATPFVTGILKTINISDLMAQWTAQLDEFVNQEKGNLADYTRELRKFLEAWIAEQETAIGQFTEVNSEIYNQWLEATQQTFYTWLENLQTDLGGADVAGNLQLQIQAEEIRRILTSGFAGGNRKVFSEDGLTITTTDDDGRILKKVFTSDFSTMTVELTGKDGGLLGKQVKVFDPSGLLITTSTTYVYGRGFN